MIRSPPRGATHEALAAELARIEALETDPSWRGVTESAKEGLRMRIAQLKRTGRAAELRWSDVPRTTA